MRHDWSVWNSGGRVSRGIWALCVVLVLCWRPSVAHAQTAGPASKLGFDVTGPASLAEANTLVVKAYLDLNTAGTTLTGLVCTAGTVANTYACMANLPPLTPGPHTLTATITLNAVESPRSVELGFAYIVLSITNLRIR
jgi:hypothetical protein